MFRFFKRRRESRIRAFQRELRRLSADIHQLEIRLAKENKWATDLVHQRDNLNNALQTRITYLETELHKAQHLNHFLSKELRKYSEENGEHLH